MVRDTIEARGVHDPRVLDAMRRVPRHRFVPPHLRDRAYEDHPLPIGDGQSISQPYVVAVMAELAEVQPGHRVLDVGTGSGYQAAVLAALGAEVYTVERVEALADAAERALESAGFPDVHQRVGNGRAGWPQAAPFHAILVGAAAASVPDALIQQLHPEGRLIIPVGDDDVQELLLIDRTPWGELRRRSVFRVLFVPLQDA